jgi:hypothetical protein
MGPGLNGNGVVIRRHDITKFRNQAGQPAPPAVNGQPVNPDLPQIQP